MIYPALPIKALSIRQPWVWSIMHAGKDIENRPRRSHFRGRVAVHASLWSDDAEEMRLLRWMRDEIGVALPDFGGDSAKAFQRGGIIGTVEIVDCVTESDSPWFFGQYGYILRDPQPVDFIPVIGALGFFDWRARL